MKADFVYTEFSPRVETLLGRSWKKVLSAGLGIAFAGIVVISLPRLVAGLIALGLFVIAGIVLSTAHHLWQLHKIEEADIS